jgi:hypothetical protein
MGTGFWRVRKSIPIPIPIWVLKPVAFTNLGALETAKTLGHRASKALGISLGFRKKLNELD